MNPKSRRRTKAEIGQLEAQIHDALEATYPQSVRHVFYLMTNPRLSATVDKTEHGYKQLADRLTKMRRSGAIPYHWITDSTRRGHHVSTYHDKAGFLRSINSLYRQDLWSGLSDYVEVWTESRSIAGVIEDDCQELAVSLYPAGGFTSISLAYQAAQYINRAMVEGRHQSANVVYIGDYDPAGVLIDRSIERELRKHLNSWFDLYVHRIAINEGQIAEYDLPTKPRKSGDKRARHVATTVEAEAMPVEILRHLLRDKVESFIPAGSLDVTRTVEEEERRGLDLLADELENAASQ